MRRGCGLALKGLSLTGLALAGWVVVGAGLSAAPPPPPPSSPETSPQVACLTDGRVDEILLLGETVYLAGAFDRVRPPGAAPGDPEEEARRWFAACDGETGAVLPWDPQVDCATTGCSNPGGRALAATPDGSALYLGGRFKSVGGAAVAHLARVDAVTAALDGSWLPGPTDRVHEILVTPERVLVGGNFGSVGGTSRPRLAALDPATGGVLGAFEPAIAATGFSTVYSLELSRDGLTLYLGGQFETVNGVARPGAAAVDAATGTLTLAFAPDLADTNPNDPAVQVREIEVDGDWVYLCGDWWQTEGEGSRENQRNVNRFDPATGAVDRTFWVGTDGGVQTCRLDESHRLLFVGGHFDCVVRYDGGVQLPGGEPCGGDGLVGFQQRDLFALDLADGRLVDWNPDTSGIGGAWAMATEPGRLWVGGDLGWPRTGTASHENLLSFETVLFADGFESGDRSRWP